MDRIDPRRDFGDFTVVTQSGTPYRIEARRERVTGAVTFTSPRPEHCFTPAFIGEIVIGSPMDVTKRGGTQGCVTSPVASIQRTGIGRLDTSKDAGEYIVTTEHSNTFALFVSGEKDDMPLIRHDLLFANWTYAHVGPTPNVWGVIEAGKPLVVLSSDSSRVRHYSRIITIIPSE